MNLTEMTIPNIVILAAVWLSGWIMPDSTHAKMRPAVSMLLLAGLAFVFFFHGR